MKGDKEKKTGGKLVGCFLYIGLLTGGDVQLMPPLFECRLIDSE